MADRGRCEARLDCCRLECWLRPFPQSFRAQDPAAVCVHCITQGLVGPGERKSVQPMAERVVPVVMTNCIISWRPVSGMRHR